MLIAPHATTTTSAEYSSRSPPGSPGRCRSTTTRSTRRPVASVSNRVTSALVRSVTLAWRSAGSTQITWASALPLVMHGYPSQVAHRTHGDRNGAVSSIRMPFGSGNGSRPAPRRSSCSYSIRGSWLIAGYG